MIAIRQEIGEIEAGRMPRSDNPLTNAPHIGFDLTARAPPAHERSGLPFFPLGSACSLVPDD
jgi:hypothetical protein